MWVPPLGWEDSPGGGHGSPPQCSCLETPMDGGPEGLQFVGLQSQAQLKRLSMHSTSNYSVLNILVSQIK